jgi:uncharacterized membrane-anchored protein YitT (DUF2179 family)
MTDELEESSLPGSPGFLLQTLIAGPLLMIVVQSWFVNASASYDGLPTLVGWFINGAYFSVVTICIVSVVGLPLRLWWRPRAWWVAHWWVPLCGIGLGLVVIVLGSLRGSETFIDGSGYRDYVDGVNLPLAVVGWFILAFFAMHSWWPEGGSRAEKAEYGRPNR